MAHATPGARNERCERTANEWLARTDARLAARSHCKPAPAAMPARVFACGMVALVAGIACAASAMAGAPAVAACAGIGFVFAALGALG